MEKIKWGVLGTAGIADGCTIPGMLQAENCELYGIAGRKEEKVKQFREKFNFQKTYYDYDLLLKDDEIQAVYIPLPNHLHYEWVMKAIDAGKHVLCEKPLAPTEEQAKELFEAAEKGGVLLVEAFAYLNSPYISALKQEAENKTIGDICYVETAFLTSGYNDTNIRMNKDYYGGATYDLGCYCTSMILSILGKKPEKVSAVAEFSENGIDVMTSCIMQFGNGIRASFNCGMNLEKEMSRRFDRLYIHGSRGYIKSSVEYNQEGSLEYIVCVDGKEEIKTVNALHNYRLEIEKFGRCILDNEKPFVQKEFSIANAYVIDRVLEAIGY